MIHYKNLITVKKVPTIIINTNTSSDRNSLFSIYEFTRSKCTLYRFYTHTHRGTHTHVYTHTLSLSFFLFVSLPSFILFYKSLRPPLTCLQTIL